jgi:hypothetical protein
MPRIELQMNKVASEHLPIRCFHGHQCPLHQAISINKLSYQPPIQVEWPNSSASFTSILSACLPCPPHSLTVVYLLALHVAIALPASYNQTILTMASLSGNHTVDLWTCSACHETAMSMTLGDCPQCNHARCIKCDVISHIAMKTDEDKENTKRIESFADPGLGSAFRRDEA